MRSRTTLYALLFAVGLFVLPYAAHAAIPFFGPIVPDAANRCAAGWGAVIQVINNIIEFLITLIVVFIAPLMLAYAGFMYVVNPVNPSNIQKAKDMMLNTVYGLIVALVGWMVVDAVMVVLYDPDINHGKAWSDLITSGGYDFCLIQASALSTLKQADIQGINANGLITTPGGTQIGASGLNVTKAVAALDTNAESAPTGYCASYVRQALVAGGFTQFSSGGPSAKDYGPLLTKAGFSTVNTTNGYTPQIGDVIVFQPVAGHPDGHIEMYDGKQWVSDFKQSGILPSGDYDGGSRTIYRS